VTDVHIVLLGCLWTTGAWIQYQNNAEWAGRWTGAGYTNNDNVSYDRKHQMVLYPFSAPYRDKPYHLHNLEVDTFRDSKASAQQVEREKDHQKSGTIFVYIDVPTPAHIETYFETRTSSRPRGASNSTPG
jgi:hypothetical protein